MDQRTAEWLELLARALLWAAGIVLILALIGAIRVATSESGFLFFQDIETESRGLAALAALGWGITAAGILAGLGGILRVLLSLDISRLTEFEALRSAADRPVAHQPVEERHAGGVEERGSGGERGEGGDGGATRR